MEIKLTDYQQKVLDKWIKRHGWSLHSEEMKALVEDMSEANWIKVGDELPNKDTRYAARYGVSVIVFDEEDYRPTPHNAIFDFREQIFKVLATGPKGGSFIWTRVSHWQPYSVKPYDAKIINF